MSSEAAQRSAGSAPEVNSGCASKSGLILMMLVGASLLAWSVYQQGLDVSFKHSAFMVAKQSTEVPGWAQFELRNLKRLDDAMTFKIAGLALVTFGACGLLITIVRRAGRYRASRPHTP